MHVAPVECAICSPNYREHALRFYERTPRPSMYPRDTITLGEPGDANIYIQVGVASNPFIDALRFNKSFSDVITERYYRRFLGEEKREMRNVYRPFTIRVYNLQQASIEAALEKSSPIIESCLFTLSYMKNINLTLMEEWPGRQPRTRPFRLNELHSGSGLPFPRANYNSDLIRFYQRGLATEDPVNQFLSFYQILEFFFVSVSDEQLYSKLRRRMIDPRFLPTPQNLDRIIQDTIEHKRETDETEMLKMVLTKFIDEQELIDFIKAYEAFLNDQIYTKKRNIFGEELETKFNQGHIIGNIAKRIKTIRNALVHSSDRYERKERYVPGSSSENMIKREVPLLKFIAEKVVIASGK